MTRRRSHLPCGTIVLGLLLAPALLALAGFGLVLAAEAMGIDTQASVEAAVQEALAYAGLAPATPTVAPATLTPLPSPTPFLPLSVTSTADVPTPTASPSPTPTETPTSTPCFKASSPRYVSHGHTAIDTWTGHGSGLRPISP